LDLGLQQIPRNKACLRINKKFDPQINGYDDMKCLGSMTFQYQHTAQEYEPHGESEYLKCAEHKIESEHGMRQRQQMKAHENVEKGTCTIESHFPTFECMTGIYEKVTQKSALKMV
jgi:hypothetical protein